MIITQVRKYKIRAGLPLNLEIDFVGSPDPTVEWSFRDGQPLATELIVDSKQGKTSIFFPATKRFEAGNYVLKLANEIGKDEGIFEINIQG
jgi:hypothetical protein